MREKARRTPLRRSRQTVTRTGGMKTADWVLYNESGWGVPHYWVAVLAGLVVGLRSLGRGVGRLATWIAARRSRATRA